MMYATKNNVRADLMINIALIIGGGYSSVASAAEFISAAHLTVVKTVVNLS